MEGATKVVTEEERLSLHVDVGGIVGDGSDLVSEENGGGIQVLAHAVSDYPAEFLDLFFSHCIEGNGGFLLLIPGEFCRGFRKGKNGGGGVSEGRK